MLTPGVSLSLNESLSVSLSLSLVTNCKPKYCPQHVSTGFPKILQEDGDGNCQWTVSDLYFALLFRGELNQKLSAVRPTYEDCW